MGCLEDVVRRALEQPARTVASRARPDTRLDVVAELADAGVAGGRCWRVADAAGVATVADPVEGDEDDALVYREKPDASQLNPRFKL
jgi:hypothetical protein